jgi:type III pantothenate kinase
MRLAIDIGNTKTKFALFDNSGLRQYSQDREELVQWLKQGLVQKAIICKTGSENETEEILSKSGVSPLYLSTSIKLPITFTYTTPNTLGADRLATAVAAFSSFPLSNVLTIGAGTCIIYDFVNEKGVYEGGAISPGLAMRFKALNNYTAKLPLIERPDDGLPELVGDSTANSILSGVLNGAINEVDGIIKQYQSRYANLKIIITGGDSPFFVSNLKNDIFARQNLVLEGLNIILQHNE